MAAIDFPSRSRNHGVALFVVLGAIVIFTLLGVVGITLADRFARNSGSLVDMRSERMTAVGALNFAVDAMQANSAATIAILNKFRQDQSKSWLQLPSSPSGTIGLGDQTWTLLGTGNDQSSVAVKILGVGAPGADSVDILLEGHGKGRGGDEFKVQATYTIHGVGLSDNVPTAGTNNALQAQAGLDNINTTTIVDGGLYSGGTNVTTIQPQNATPGSWQLLRTNGSLLVSKDAVMPSGAIIKGTLGSNGGNLTVSGNLSVRGGIDDVNNFTKLLTVNGAMLLKGATFPSNGFSGGLSVRDSLLVTDAFFKYAGNSKALNVGSGVGSWAVFNAGFFFSGVNNPSTPQSQVNGNFFVKTAASPNANGIDNGILNVTQNTFFDADFTLSGGTLNLNNVAFRNAALVTNTGNQATMNVAGQSSFGGGIVGGTNGPKYITLNGDSYLSGSVNPIGTYNSAQITFTGGGNLSLSGTIKSDFGNAYKWNLSRDFSGCTYNYWTSAWTCPNTIKPTITYSSGQRNVSSACGTYGPPWAPYYNPGPCFNYSSSVVAPIYTSFASVPAPTWSWLSTVTPTMTETSLGFTVNQQNLDPTAPSNAISMISWSSLPSDVQAYADWKTLRAKLPGNPLSNGMAPTAAQLASLYNIVKGEGMLYGQSKGGDYMIIHIADMNDFMNTNGPAGAAAAGPIPSGVKVFFEIDKMNQALTLYSGSSGSRQIVDAHGVDGGAAISFSGTFYGFVQLHTVGSGSLIFAPAGVGCSFFGSLEVDGTRTLRVQNDGWSISNQAQAAKDVLSDIAKNFNNSTINATSVIRFNGDANTTTPFTPTPTVIPSDGWIQFERKGEFR